MTDIAPRPPRWYVVALVVGIAMGALPLALGTVLTFGGDAVGACSNEMGCALFYLAGLCATPAAFIVSTIASGIKARRLAVASASRSRTWKEAFRVAFVALILTGLSALLAAAAMSS